MTDTNQGIKIAVVEDHWSYAEGISQFLRDAGFQVYTCKERTDVEGLFAFSLDIALVDHDLSGFGCGWGWGSGQHIASKLGLPKQRLINISTSSCDKSYCGSWWYLKEYIGEKNLPEKWRGRPGEELSEFISEALK